MKLSTLLLAAAATVSASAGAANAETLWIGNAFVTAANQPTCGPAASVGDSVRVIYRPVGTALGNSAGSYFAYVGQRSNVTMYVPNNTFRAGINYSGRYVSSYLNWATASGAITAWSLTPATLGTNTLEANLVATFTNFYGIKGCTVSMRVAFEQAD